MSYNKYESVQAERPSTVADNYTVVRFPHSGIFYSSRSAASKAAELMAERNGGQYDVWRKVETVVAVARRTQHDLPSADLPEDEVPF